MSRTANPVTARSGKIKLSLTQTNYKKLFALAELDGKPAAVIVRELVENYLASREHEIAAALDAAEPTATPIKPTPPAPPIETCTAERPATRQINWSITID